MFRELGEARRCRRRSLRRRWNVGGVETGLRWRGCWVVVRVVLSVVSRWRLVLVFSKRPKGLGGCARRVGAESGLRLPGAVHEDVV